MLSSLLSIPGLLALSAGGGPGLSRPQQQASYGTSLDFWLVLFILAVLLIVLLWWALRRPIRRTPSSHAAPQSTAHAPVQAAAPPAAAPVAPTADPDLPAEPPAAPPAVATEPVAEVPAEEAPVIAAEAPVEEAPVVEAPEALAEEAPAKEPIVELTDAEPGPIAEVAREGSATEPGEPDDLRRIEGIGPKVEQALHKIGITTFAQLAETDAEGLEEQIRAEGVRILPGAPQTWPEQAALAAEGDWAGFDQLTEQLKGGRRQ